VSSVPGSISPGAGRGLLAGLAVAGLLLASAPARAACGGPSTTAQVARLLSTADAAFSDLDEDAFRSAVAQTRNAIPCLAEPMNDSLAAAWHRAEAYQAFLDRDHAATVQAFRAMLGASPGYRLSDVIAPEGHPLRTDFEIAQGLPPEPTRPAPVPTQGSLLVDGKPTQDVPAALPFVFQQLGEDGKPLRSVLIEQGASLPLYDARPLRGSSQDGARAGHRKLGAPLVAAAVVAGVTSASLYGISSNKASQFWDESTPDTSLDQLRRQTNGTAAGSVVAGVVAIGAGTAAVLTFVW